MYLYVSQGNISTHDNEVVDGDFSDADVRINFLYFPNAGFFKYFYEHTC